MKGYFVNKGLDIIKEESEISYTAIKNELLESYRLAEENKRLNEKLELLKNTVLELNVCEMRNCYEVPIHEYEKLIEIAMVGIFEDSSS